MPAPVRRIPLFSTEERAVFFALTRLALGNPFLPARIDREREILREAFVYPGRFMSPGPDPRVHHENVGRITELLQRTMPAIRDRYAAGAEVSDADRTIYIVSCVYFLYDSFDTQFRALIEGSKRSAPFYKRWLKAYQHYLGFLLPAADVPKPAHAFAILFQVCRAFYYLYVKVRGRSLPVAQLRARIWNAIFGGDLDKYGFGLWTRMSQLSTLIQGPTGTGKELTAEAIARSGYVPFDAETMTFAPYEDYYQALNLLEFAPGILESELFGHRKGAFTGATRDKKGVLETLLRFGGLLLDEVGELEIRMQVKLLRVLQERKFRRVGDEGGLCDLQGRLLSATHRDPAESIAQGLLREDFFRRICLHKIVTPSLRERFDDTPEEIRDLVALLVEDPLSPAPTDPLVDEVEAFVRARLPRHPWTGNMRELLQCVWDIQTTHAYLPEAKRSDGTLEEMMAASGLTVDEMFRRYAVRERAKRGSDAETARALGVDPRRIRRMLAGE